MWKHTPEVSGLYTIVAKHQVRGDWVNWQFCIDLFCDKGRVVKECEYYVGDLETVVWGEGSHLGVTGKRSVFGVKYTNGIEGVMIPVGGQF